jgi:integrase
MTAQIVFSVRRHWSTEGMSPKTDFSGTQPPVKRTQMAKHLIASKRTIDVLKRDVLRLNDGDGLHIRQSSTGSKYWYQDFSLRGKRGSIGLGKYPEIGLADARQRSLEVRGQVANHINPAAARKAAKQTQAQLSDSCSVETIANSWLAIQSKGWSAGHTRTERARLEAHVYPSLGGRQINSVKTAEVSCLIGAIGEAGTVDTAHRVLSLCRRLFDYAVSMGQLDDNPCDKVKQVLPKSASKHHAAMTTPFELKGLLQRIPDFSGTFAVQCALKVTMLTFLRSAELRGAKWPEINLAHQVWLVPASRMKSNKERKLNGGPHYVPLSSQAVEILRQLKPITGHTGYVFAGQGSKNPVISGNTVNKSLRRLGFSTRDEHSTHGFRATARTMLVEQLNFSENVVELQLDHAVRDANGTAYNRAAMLKTRVVMMQRWADYLDWLSTQSASTLGPLHESDPPVSLCAPAHEDWANRAAFGTNAPSTAAHASALGNKATSSNSATR